MFDGVILLGVRWLSRARQNLLVGTGARQSLLVLEHDKIRHGGECSSDHRCLSEFTYPIIGSRTNKTTMKESISEFDGIDDEGCHSSLE